MLPNKGPVSDTNTNNNPAQQGAEAASPPSVKQLIDFQALSQLMQATAKLAGNLDERLQGGAKGGFYLDGGRISNTNLKQQMEEVCALKKKIEDLEPMMKKAIIMAEPEPVHEPATSKRAARSKGGKAAVAATAVTEDHDKRIADLENMIKSHAERIKKTEDENKKLGALVAQLETKAGKQTGSSQFTPAQVQTLNNSQKVQKGDSKRIDQLEDKTSSLTRGQNAQTQALNRCQGLQEEHSDHIDQLVGRMSSLETSVPTTVAAKIGHVQNHVFYLAACIYELQKRAGVAVLGFIGEDQEKVDAWLQKFDIAK